MNKAISVSELNTQIKSLMESTFVHVYVEGEISNLTYHNSGHIYFSIKDESSTISCVMFKGNAQYLKFRLEVGAKINIHGSITVYAPRGNYQLLCSKIEPSGIGALALAYEQLKTKLQNQGYFDPSIKKSLPKFPKKIAIVTSNTGAAIEDMKKILAKRWPLAKMILVPTLVQGIGAKEDIVSSIKVADSLNADLMIVGRGGGSIEDLWAFNEECVAQAIFEATTPIISAVGHESDIVISDFVADVRASTPSNAIEIATSDSNDLRIYLDTLWNQFSNSFLQIHKNRQQQLIHIQKSYQQHSLEARFTLMNKQLKDTIHQMNAVFQQVLIKKQNEIIAINNGFSANHPDKKISFGYVQTTKEQKIIDISLLNKEDEFNCETPKVSILCKVIEKSSF